MSAEQIDQPEIESLLSSCQLEGGGSADQIMFAVGLAAGRAEQRVATPNVWKAATAVLAASLMISLGWNAKQLKITGNANSTGSVAKQATNETQPERLAGTQPIAPTADTHQPNSGPDSPPAMEPNNGPSSVTMGFVATASGQMQPVKLGSGFYSTTEEFDRIPKTGFGERIPRLGSF